MHNKSKRERDTFARRLLKDDFGGKQLLKNQAWGAIQAEELLFGQKSRPSKLFGMREKGGLAF